MDIEELKKKLESINPKLYDHCVRTMDEAKKLAEHYKADVEKAQIAGLLHDSGKGMTKGLDNLTHSKTGRDLAREVFNVQNEEILNAIMYHTTGRENMTLLEKIIFIADKIEPKRNFEGIEELRKTAYTNIDKAIIMSLESTIEYVRMRNLELDNDSLETLKFLGGKMQDKKNIETILNACDSKKAYNFTVLNISKTSSITDYFIICSANNERQTVAIADEVLKKGYEAGIDFYYHEGFDTGRWILLETDNIIVHIFHRDEREVYDLESLWFDNNSIDVEQYGIKNWK